jgi:hypothetical protein
LLHPRGMFGKMDSLRIVKILATVSPAINSRLKSHDSTLLEKLRREQLTLPAVAPVSPPGYMSTAKQCSPTVVFALVYFTPRTAPSFAKLGKENVQTHVKAASSFPALAIATAESYGLIWYSKSSPIDRTVKSPARPQGVGARPEVPLHRALPVRFTLKLHGEKKRKRPGNTLSRDVSRNTIKQLLTH